MNRPEDPSVEAYRAASGELGETPAPGTRAAILAAAAREVQAKPQDAAAPLALEPVAEEHIEVAAVQAPADELVRKLPPPPPVSVRKPRPAAQATDNVREFPAARWRSRWPLAAAASVLVAALAVTLTLRTERGTAPRITPPATNVARAPAPVESQAPAASTSAATVADATPTPASPASPPPKAEAKVATPAAAPTASPAAAAEASSAPAAAPPAPSAPTQTAERQEAASSALTEATAKRTQPAAAAAAGPSVDGAIAQADAAAPAGSAGKLAAEARRADAAPARAANAAPMRAKSDLPDDWIARIIELRRAGRDDEAEAELRRFRERYPHIHVPASALARPAPR